MTKPEVTEVVRFHKFSTDPTPAKVRKVVRAQRTIRPGLDAGTYVRFSSDPHPVWVPERRSA
jgi:hypothetical protein